MPAQSAEEVKPAEPEPATAGGRTRDSPPPAARLRRFTVPAVPAAVALLVSFLGLGGPSFWLDEAATVSMVRRPLPDMMRAVLGHLDLVHALYYLLMRPVAAVFGTGEVAMRAPSALATAAAAAGIAVLGRRCAGAATGVLAGLCYACAPTVTRYAQEARSFALVTATVVLAAYLLVRAVQDDRRRWQAGYGAVVLLTGLLNLFAFLIVAAHAVTLLWGRASGAVTRRTLFHWCVTTAVASAVLAPFAVWSQSQQEQISRIPAPTWNMLWGFARFLSGGDGLIPPTFVLLALALVVGHRHMPELAALAVPWLLLPPSLLLGVSLVSPVFRPRYTLICLPALALLIAVALVWLWRSWRPPAVLVVAVAPLLVVPAQLAARTDESRQDDLRSAAIVLRAHARPGDTVLFLTSHMRWRAAGYPDAYAGLHDAMAQSTPVEAGNLLGREAHVPDMLKRLCRADRVWIIAESGVAKNAKQWVRERRAAAEGTGPYRTAGVWRYMGTNLTLLVRTRPAEQTARRGRVSPCAEAAAGRGDAGPWVEPPAAAGRGGG